jgi:hypothetical protein
MTSYLVCRTCGKHMDAESAVNGEWCSGDCTCTYGTCKTCGRFFLTGQGFDDSHCSRECTVRYSLLRKYGPAPVTVVTEV